ncbi:MAG: hypothetical protein LBI84_05345 [Propionibacteriaceae bacterium]|jgi:hypothetical protein|nr:hypothetical protein [Propionibacteriaceae bacterium]
MSSAGQKAGRAALAIVAAASLLALGVLAGLAYSWQEPPSLLRKPALSGEFPVAQVEFDNARTVSLSGTLAGQASALSPRAGRLTGSACQPGGTLESGKMAVEIDGVPLPGLATAKPLWRDLEPGDKGDDVVALTTELIRLQWLAGEPAETMTQAAVNAFNAMAANLGAAKSELAAWTVFASLVVWLPPGPLIVDSCPVDVGAALAPDQVLIRFAPLLTEARVTADPATSLGGDQVLVLSDSEITVPDGGVVTDPNQLALLAASAQFRFAQLANDTTITVVGVLKLVEPISVSVIAPAALVATGPAAGCVVADGENRPVRVVASVLGQTFVLFDGRPPASVLLNPPRDIKC